MEFMWLLHDKYGCSMEFMWLTHGRYGCSMEFMWLTHDRYGCYLEFMWLQHGRYECNCFNLFGVLSVLRHWSLFIFLHIIELSFLSSLSCLCQHY